jgi:hypothetical protein
MSVNKSEAGDSSGGPDESFLFLLTSDTDPGTTIPSGLLCHPDDSCLLLTLARQLKIAVQESSPTAAHSQPNSVERCASELCEFTGVYRNDHYQRP